MRHSWLMTIVLAIAVALPGVPVLSPVSDGAARAEGGRGPVDGTPGVKPGKKTKKGKPARKPAAPQPDPKTFVPATTISKHDSVDYIQKDLESEARGDNLKRMATSRSRISALRAHIDAAYIATQDSAARNEPNRINQQLTSYRSQRTNKQLRAYAGLLLGAVAADRADAQARDLLKRYREAAKAKQEVKAALIKGDYEDARAEYYSRVRRLPEAFRNMFQGLPKDPAKP